MGKGRSIKKLHFFGGKKDNFWHFLKEKLQFSCNILIFQQQFSGESDTDVKRHRELEVNQTSNKSKKEKGEIRTMS